MVRPSHERLTLNIEDVARILGINGSTAYELARRNEFPVPIIYLGRRMVVSRVAIEALLASRTSAHDAGASI